MKQTAVEWLANRIIELEERLRQKEININDFFELKDELVEQALEMEKEQLIETWKHGNLPTFLGKTLTAEEYYNKTYKTNKE